MSAFAIPSSIAGPLISPSPEQLLRSELDVLQDLVGMPWCFKAFGLIA
jgi:hypothetical protein